MRRTLRHGLVGVAAAALTVAAGVTALGSPDDVVVAAPPPVTSTTAPGEFVPVAYVPADPVADAERAETAVRDGQEAERARVAAAAAETAYQRALSLGEQGDAIDKQSADNKAEVKAKTKARIAAAKARIAAAKARAEAAEAEAAAAQERARRAAIANEGYTPGTTDVREIARQILANKFSYSGDQFSCFDWIIEHESNWNVHATNPSSGAYGLPQSLPGNKMASVASDWRDNPATQIIWGVSYMKSRYGSPCDAKSYWQGHGNY